MSPAISCARKVIDSPCLLRDKTLKCRISRARAGIQHLSSPHSRQSSKHLRNMKLWNRNQTVPGLAHGNGRNRERQRKLFRSIRKLHWLEEEELNTSISAWKLCSEIDSEDLTEKRNNIAVDINLLKGAMERSLVCKSCHCPVFSEELEEHSGQGVWDWALFARMRIVVSFSWLARVN